MVDILLDERGVDSAPPETTLRCDGAGGGGGARSRPREGWDGLGAADRPVYEAFLL